MQLGIKPNHLHTVNKIAYRAKKFSSIFTSYIELEYLRVIKKKDKSSIGEWTRERLTKMGPTFVKIGQFMSTRTDVFGEEITDQLKKLQDNVLPLKYEELEDFIGVLKNNFTYIDPNPIASASIGQVHEGRLKQNNERVVLKVKRPGIEEQIIDDFETLLFGIGILKNLSNDRKINEFELLFNEYFKLLKEEIDFDREAQNMTRFQKMFEKKKWVKIPKVYKELSNNDIITMEFVGANKIDDFQKIDALGFDREKMAKKLVELFISQVIDYGFVHIDPHPGNVGISDNGKIVFYDFGMILDLDMQLKDKFKKFLLAIYDKDVDAICNIVIDMDLVVVEPKNIPYFKIFLVSFLSYIETANLEEFKLNYIDKLNTYSTPFLISSKFILLLRGISILEGVCKRLDPNFNFKKIIDPYIDEFLIDVNYFESKAITDINLITKVPDKVQMNQIQLEVLENSIRDVEKKISQEQSNNYSTLLAGFLIMIMHNEFDQGLLTALFLGLSYVFILNNGKIYRK